MRDISSTKISGATFTITQLDDEADLSSGDTPNYKAGGHTATATTGADGTASFAQVPGGWYEVKETTPPTGYLVVGNSTFYVKIDGGKATLLHKGTGAPKTWADASEADKYNSTSNANCNVMAYTQGVAASGQTAAVDAVITVGNVAGTELPSTGGPGTTATTALGIALLAAALLAATKRQASINRHTRKVRP